MTMGRRKSRRRHVRYFAVIRHGSLSLPCLVLDISDAGARRQLNRSDELPDEFASLLSRNGKVRRWCQRVWRDENTMGVHFVVSPRPGPEI
jgi:hypothetical protein